MEIKRDPVIGFYDIASNLSTRLDDYLKLDDRVIYNFNYSLGCWKKSEDLVIRLHERRLYKLIGRLIIPDHFQLNTRQTLNLILKKIEEPIAEQDLCIVVRFQVGIFYFD